jgi:hypothetical protein
MKFYVSHVLVDKDNVRFYLNDNGITIHDNAPLNSNIAFPNCFNIYIQ